MGCRWCADGRFHFDCPDGKGTNETEYFKRMSTPGLHSEVVGVTILSRDCLLRQDRLKQFYFFVASNRNTIEFGHLPGISGSTALGINAIFCHIPPRMLAEGIISWLRDHQSSHLKYITDDEPLTTEEITAGLAHFGYGNTQLRGDGNPS